MTMQPASNANCLDQPALALEGGETMRLQQGSGGQMGWPLACEELIVITHPSGPMTSNES